METIVYVTAHSTSRSHTHTSNLCSIREFLHGYLHICGIKRETEREIDLMSWFYMIANSLNS